MSDRSNQIVVTHLHRALEATGLAAVVVCLALAAAAGPGRDIKPKPARALPATPIALGLFAAPLAACVVWAGRGVYGRQAQLQ